MKARSEEIKRTSQKFYQLWKQHPKLRAGQIITILTADVGKDLYDISDKEFFHQILEELNK